MDKFRRYTYIDCKTGIGQLVEITCNPDDKEKVKQFIAENVRTVSHPTNKEMNIEHGGYGRYTRFNIKQHKYAGGRGGYYEALEILNPPDGRCSFVIYKYTSKANEFYEYESLELMMKDWKKHFGDQKTAEKRKVSCGMLAPWFYAWGDQVINGDLVLPDEGVLSDTFYRTGSKFLVYNRSGAPEVKECLCCHERSREVYDHSGFYTKYKEEKSKIITWTDGSYSWESDTKIEPMVGDQMWIAEAFEKFKELCAGKRKNFVIKFEDGSTFRGSWSKPKDEDEAGIYFVEADMKRDGKVKHQEGIVKFKPTKEYPRLRQYIEATAKKNGCESVTVKKATRQRQDGWTGIYKREDTDD